MLNAEYIMLSKETGLMRELDYIANNIANVNTPGFQKDKLLFSQYVADSGKNEKMSYAIDKQDFRDTQNGNLKLTNKTFDVAINGDGYFVINTPDGIRYTRAGNFTLNENSVLVTQQGHPVGTLDGGEIVLQPGDVDIVIKNNGIITANGEDRGALGVAVFENNQLMKKVGNGMLTTDQEALEADFALTKVYQGYIEESNVNPIAEIANLIKTTKLAESTNLFLANYDELTKNAIRKISQNS